MNIKIYPDFEVALRQLLIAFYQRGKRVITDSWQAQQKKIEFYELFNTCFSVQLPQDTPVGPGYSLDKLRTQIQPNLPWSDLQFEERVSGLPLNPGESYKQWPFYGQDKQMRPDEKFSHTYMERYWPKNLSDGPYAMQGIRFSYGDLNNVLKLLENDLFTRQAFLPIFFPEDTGAAQGQRVPCTLGYLFMRRGEYLHITYYIRSCDYYRHLRDDIYMTVRLLYWMIERLQYESPELKPGTFTMHIQSLHIFYNELPRLRKEYEG